MFAGLIREFGVRIDENCQAGTSGIIVNYIIIFRVLSYSIIM